MMKRILLLLFTTCIALSSIAQQKRKWRGNYLLSATIENVQTGTAILKYVDNTRRGSEEKVKLAAIAAGKFSFSDYIEEPAYATLEIENKEYTLYIDPTQMSAKILSDRSIEILDSWSNDDKKKIEQLNNKINELADNADHTQDNLAELSFASITKDSFVVLRKMQELTKNKNSDAKNHQMISILMNMPDALKNTPTGIRTSEVLFLASMKMHNAK